MSRFRPSAAAMILLCGPALLLAAGGLAAQQAEGGGPPAVTEELDSPAPGAADTLAPAGGPRPAGALLRSTVLPGWGQIHAGSPVRGAVYMAAHAGNVFMLLKTRHTLSEARDAERERMRFAEDSIRAAALEDAALAERLADNPELIGQMVDQTRPVMNARALRLSREDQLEDWLVWSGFWILASAVDAFVAAHLADFPAGIDVSPVAGGGVRMQLRLVPGSR